jgi:hypothetical protein
MDIDELLKKIPMRADVSAMLHPGALVPVLQKLPERLQTSGVETLSGLHPAIGKVKELEVEARPRVTRTIESVHGGTMTRIDRHPTGLERAAGQASAKIVERTRGLISRNSALFKGEREKLRKEIDTGLAAKPEIASEIRSRLAARKKDERFAFANSRIAAGDRDTALAILGAPGWISGLDDTELPKLREAAERQFFGPQLEQVAAIDDVLHRLDLGEKDLTAAHDLVLGHVQAAEEATKERTAAIAALAAETA